MFNTELIIFNRDKPAASRLSFGVKKCDGWGVSMDTCCRRETLSCSLTWRARRRPPPRHHQQLLLLRGGRRLCRRRRRRRSGSARCMQPLQNDQFARCVHWPKGCVSGQVGLAGTMEFIFHYRSLIDPSCGETRAMDCVEMASPLSPAEVQHFLAFGYVHRRGCFTPDEMAALTAHADRR